MIIRLAWAGLALGLALSVTGCSCCHKKSTCAPTPVAAGAPPCCPAPNPCGPSTYPPAPSPPLPGTTNFVPAPYGYGTPPQ